MGISAEELMNDPAGSGRPSVVFTDQTIGHEALDLLAPTCHVRVLTAYPSEHELVKACADAHGILARLGTISTRVIDSAPYLRIIARHGVGVDAVDLEAATRRGVVVTTTGSENAAAVAEYTFALLLALVRKVLVADSGMRKGEWSREALVGMELDGRTLGIIGLGAIGRRVARQANGFGMRVLAFDPKIQDAQDPGIALTSLEDLLERSDVITLHTRLTSETARLIDARALARMKPGAYLVNTARGEVVDQAALIAALSSGALGGAALDTYEQEPLPVDSPLRRLSNVVLSPHVAGQTGAALVRVAISAAQAILDEFAGRQPKYVYNPEAYDVRAARDAAPP
jgi:D-3-phosphoglycerate dehydrogenase